MKIVAISDLHGHLPQIPECDFLFIAGDLTPSSNVNHQRDWLQVHFSKWLNNTPAKEIVGIAGNHDFIFQEKPHLVPNLKWHYLEDRMIELSGLKIYGTPWQPIFYHWAFNLSEPELEKKFVNIPEGTDVLISHGPPFGIGDTVVSRKGDEEKWQELEHVGSTSLLEKVLKIKPRYHFFGHIHQARGVHVKDETTFANVSIVNEQYKMIHEPMIFEI